MADWGLLAGLGQGLSGLGAALDERELRKLAEEERKMQRQRQAEQDALQKAQAASGEFQRMDALNFRPASNTDVLNNLALKRGQTEYKSDISGKTFLRDPGMSPTDLRQQNAQDKIDAAMKLQQERAASQAELARLREGGLDGRYDRVRADTEANNTARAAIEALRQSGANFRDTNGVGGGTSSRDMSLDKRQDRILAMTRDLMEPKFDRYGEVIREALTHEEAIRKAVEIVDGITNPGQAQSGGGVSGSGQSEASLAMKAQQAIQAIQNDPARSPAEKAEDIQAVNQVLTQKIAALRGGR